MSVLIPPGLVLPPPRSRTVPCERLQSSSDRSPWSRGPSQKAPKPGKNRLPRAVQDGHAPAPNPEQADDDSSEGHDVHVHDASHNRVQRRGKDGRPIMSHAGHEFVHNPEQAEVDMTKEDDAESTDTKDSGSSPHYTSGGDEDQAL